MWVELGGCSGGSHAAAAIPVAIPSTVAAVVNSRTEASAASVTISDHHTLCQDGAE